VRDDENPRELRLRAVEGGEPCFPQSGGEDHPSGTIAFGARPVERIQRLALYGMRLDGREGLRRYLGWDRLDSPPVPIHSPDLPWGTLRVI
jgi:hypothetical protein